MGSWRSGWAALTVVAVVVAGCGAAVVSEAGHGESDRIAEVVAVALGTPRPRSAATLQRHVAALPAGADGTVEVLAAVDLPATELVDPLARMTWRVTLERPASWTGSAGGRTSTCYDVWFSYYGAVDMPTRVRCPADAPALVPPPATEPFPLGDPVPVCRSGSGDCAGG